MKNTKSNSDDRLLNDDRNNNILNNDQDNLKSTPSRSGKDARQKKSRKNMNDRHN